MMKKQVFVAAAIAIGAVIFAQNQAPAPAAGAPATPVAVAASPIAAMNDAQLTEKGWGQVNFMTKLGSFKSIDGEGRLEFSFSGTVLVSKLDGTLTPSGNLRTEYDKNKRRIFTGTGKLTLEGKWRGVQWFGSNMTGNWKGRGFLRIVGEFDRELNTGTFWYGADGQKTPWPANSVMSLTLPKMEYGASSTATPKERNKGG